MKLNLMQFVAFSFVLGWVAVDVVGGTYSEHLFYASIIALGTAYLNNAHGKIWEGLKKFIPLSSLKKA